MKFLSYDIEIYNDFPEGEVDLHDIIPSVAATCTTEADIHFFYNEKAEDGSGSPMDKFEAKNLVQSIMYWQHRGYTPFTWNGTGFDFKLLGYYSDLVEECAHLALNSVDGMLLVTFRKGYYLGLDAALIGAGVKGKQHTVTLNNGTEITDMDGAKAPKMWRDGDYQAVMDYLRGDVIQPLELSKVLAQSNQLKWTSKSGRPQGVFTKMELVKDLFALPEPDTSWMTDPPTRQKFVDWMPESVLKANGIDLSKLKGA